MKLSIHAIIMICICIALDIYIIFIHDDNKSLLHKYVLETSKYSIQLDLEEAHSSSSLSKGLSKRSSLPEEQGMLFVFPQSHILKFWMKDTTIPLDLLYLSEDMKIREIHQLIPLNLTPVESKARYKYALELNAGIVDKYGINIGDQLIKVE